MGSPLPGVRTGGNLATYPEAVITMHTRAHRFPKPRFSDVLTHYKVDPETVHLCSILNPTEGDDGINTCAARMSEALILANGLVSDRSTIAKGRTKAGDTPLLGGYRYTTFGNLCAHGVARGARDLGEFLTFSWGPPTHSFAGPREDAPSDIQNKQGVICFVKISTFSGQGHIDVWDNTACVGSPYWNSQKIWFWQLQ